MNFFGIGLPEIGKSLGKALKGFQEASNDFQSEFKKEVDAIETAVKTPSQIESTEAIDRKSNSNT
jgi:sec-independent protein translocase protein TatA